jgi:hypothetical protein
MSMLKRVASSTLLTGLLIGGGAAIASAQSSGSTPSTSPAPATPASATASPSTTLPVRDCLPPGHDDAWPGFVQGKPDSFEAGGLGGVYTWHDSDGWHLRVTHRNDEKAVFTGTIVTSGKLTDVHAVALEGADSLKVGPNQHSMRFAFTNYGHIDGIDFRTACAPAINLSFQRGGNEIPADRIFLGDTSAHPAGDPFRIARLP